MNSIKRLTELRDERAKELDEAKAAWSKLTAGKSDAECDEIWQEAHQTDLFIHYASLDQADSDLCLYEARSYYLPLPDDASAWEVSRVTGARHLTTAARYDLRRQILLERDREAANVSRDRSFKVSVGSLAVAALAVVISVIALAV